LNSNSEKKNVPELRKIQENKNADSKEFRQHTISVNDFQSSSQEGSQREHIQTTCINALRDGA
jgi:hypothetical protein